MLPYQCLKLRAGLSVMLGLAFAKPYSLSTSRNRITYRRSEIELELKIIRFVQPSPSA